MHLPVRRGLANATGANAARRRVRAIGAAVRLHWHWQFRSGHAAVGSQQWQAVLRGEDTVHIRLGQEEALYAVGEDVLRQRSRHRRFSQQANQSDIEALEEEAIAEERRSLHSQRYQSGVVQSAEVANR